MINAKNLAEFYLIDYNLQFAMSQIEYVNMRNNENNHCERGGEFLLIRTTVCVKYCDGLTFRKPLKHNFYPIWRSENTKKVRVSVWYVFRTHMRG